MPRDEPDIGTVTQHSSAGVSVLARLLWVGVVAGLMIGGLVAAALFAEAGLSEALDAIAVGALVGVVVGVAVQVLNAAVLHAVRRVRRELEATALRLVLMPLPTAGALILPALLVAADADGVVSAMQWLPVVSAGVLGAATAWLLSPWCLAPIAPDRAITAPV